MLGLGRGPGDRRVRPRKTVALLEQTGDHLAPRELAPAELIEPGDMRRREPDGNDFGGPRWMLRLSRHSVHAIRSVSRNTRGRARAYCLSRGVDSEAGSFGKWCSLRNPVCALRAHTAFRCR